ncbi:MAG: hypothetical protein PHV06_05655, partial [bacterium]|nr:hypothetical protein [bacterium]
MKFIKRTFIYVILIIFTFIQLLPFFWMTITSVKEQGYALKNQFFPRTINYLEKKVSDMSETDGEFQIVFAEGDRFAVIIKNPTVKHAELEFEGNVFILKKIDSYWAADVPYKEKPEILKFKITKPFKYAFKDFYTLNNFRNIWNNKDFPFKRFFVNSIIVAFFSGLFTVVLTTMGGYAFAKKDFYWKNGLFYFFLALMLVPGMIYMVPQFALVYQMGEIKFLGLG